MSLGPLFSFYDDKNKLIVSFGLPVLSPRTPFVISANGQGGVMIGQFQTSGAYTIGIAQAAATNVPEPATGALALGAGVAAALARRRRDTQQ